jgi:GNAT superfamily N-acetyltransferase
VTQQHNAQQIRRATVADTAETAELIAAAFHELDVSAWLVPDPAERLRVLAADFRIFVDHALDHGEIHLIDDTTTPTTGHPLAAAVWFPQTTGPTPPPKDYDTRLAAACGPATTRFQVLDQHFDDTHPESFPHHYLAYLATRPDRQSRGVGTTLLQHQHRNLDRDGIPAFLHASCARTRDFYQRHGYEPLGEPFHLPDGPPMWPQWREPHPPETAATT